MHIAREECPWCGTPNPMVGEPTQTLNGTALNGNGTNGHRTVTRNIPVQTVSLPAVGEMDMPTVTIDHAPLAPQPDGRGRSFWIRTYSWVLLALLLAVIGFTAAGVIQGLNDREVVSTTEAIAAYERGQELVDQGQYDLAIAYFQEALRLEPNFPAAQQLMLFAEQQLATQQGGGVVVPANTPTPSDSFDADAAFISAEEALEDGEWLAAADAFSTIQLEAPDYRPDEIQNGLFAAYEGLGRAALEEEDLDNALRYFDQALDIQPNAADLAELRRLTSSYRTAMVAFERENWSQAADQFRAVYVIDPQFLDVGENLNQSHIELAEAFEERGIWCDAAQNYRAALTIEDDDAIAAKALAAERQCSVVAAPVPPTPEITQDEIPTPSGTVTVTPTGTIFPDVRGTPVPIPTVTTRPNTSGFAYLPGAVSENLGDGCFGRYILGTVLNSDGAPVPGVTLLLVDQYGNRATAVSKDNPPGAFDLQINQASPTYQLMVVAGDQVLSTPVTIFQSEAALASGVACYSINWIQQ
jgi:tetratricopeptide (TPR) repeat protein